MKKKVTAIAAAALAAACAAGFLWARTPRTGNEQQRRAQAPPEIPGMVWIPAGEFTMGANDSYPYEGPQRKVFLDGYYIDINEVTNAQYKRFIDSAGHPAPRHWKDAEFSAGCDDLPVVNVSMIDAEAYAKWAGKRLPTEAEWEKAARGSDGRKYPWGGFWQENSANVSYFLGLGGPKPIGAYPDGKSPYGCYDMAGNVKEITASFFGPYPGSTVKHDKFGTGYAVVRGGSYRTSKTLASTYSRDIIKPDEKRSDTGFRCAK